MTRRPPLGPRIAAGGLALALSVVAAGASVATAPAEAAGCASTPMTLSRPGDAPTRYTMLLRVNKTRNARIYANRDQASGGLGGRIQPQDVFVVNTRHPGSSPAEWTEIVSILREAFPCNRIVALNGLGGDPAAPGYHLALNGSPDLWALLTDWERNDWNTARASNPRIRDWTGRFTRTRKRVRRWVGSLTDAIRLSAAPSPRRAGLVPQYRDKWDYGELARAVSSPNRRFGHNRRGIQSVQTQDFCAQRGAGGMKVITRRLLAAYKSANYRRVRAEGRAKRPRRVKRGWRVARANLGVQISFSGTPDPRAGMALLSTSPGRAAACTRSALKRGGGAILYWASPDAIRLLLATPAVCGLRPSPTGVC